ncbi:MAG: sigma-70 family RNA polymerase sigma factor [Candidatus Dormiibacterota bacterium]
MIADQALTSTLRAPIAGSGGEPIDAAVMYEQHYQTIFRYARARVSSHAQAEDLAADVFCKAVAGLARYRPLRPSTLPWLYTIASHQVADHYRRPRTALDLMEADQLADPDPDPADVVASRDLVRRVWRASERLPRSQRTAVWLRYGEELELSEIALRMGRSVGAVKLLVHRGLRGMRAAVGNSGEPTTLRVLASGRISSLPLASGPALAA